MNKEEIVEAIADDKMMPFIQPDQLAQIVDFVIKNYEPSLPTLKGWVARDDDYSLKLYTRKPQWIINHWDNYQEDCNLVYLDYSLFQEIGQGDEPIEVELIIKKA